MLYNAANDLRSEAQKHVARRECPQGGLEKLRLVSGDDPERAAMHSENRRRLARVLKDLSKEDRDILSVAYTIADDTWRLNWESRPKNFTKSCDRPCSAFGPRGSNATEASASQRYASDTRFATTEVLTDRR